MKFPKKFNSKVANLVTVIISIILVISLVVFWYTNHQQSESDQLENQPQLVRHVENFVMFYSKVILDQDRTKVIVPYKFENQPLVLWLGYKAQSENLPQLFLISHPQINQLDWPNVSDNTLTLFQKQSRYSSVEEFINSPPSGSTIIADTNLLNKYPQLKAGRLEFEIDFNTTDYILTTFKPSTETDGILYYENIIDTTDADLGTGNQIEWFIRSTDISEEKAYLLGQIHVTYLQ